MGECGRPGQVLGAGGGRGECACAPSSPSPPPRPPLHPPGKNLAPPDDELLTRLGGALVLRGRETAARHADSGILKYADWDALVAAAGVKELPP